MNNNKMCILQITAENYDDVISDLAVVVDAADFPGEQNEDNLGVVTAVFQAAAQLVSMDPTIINPEVCAISSAYSSIQLQIPGSICLCYYTIF